ncbi:MAG: hypothetical protein DHS20C18_08300 [Saprospiraceae bacterium]|nr:MAG: hypothetical protein DHS20C18_08300 [Saprospiraceae bacterium]
MQARSIDEVISILESIINECIKNNDPLGFFAILYQKVTLKVKEGIENDFFENGPRMEQLDVVFANRYIAAYAAYQNNEVVTDSWKKAFKLKSNYWPIVLQHLLMGMNAHINLDLGIAAAEISRNNNIDDLETDFKKINDILSSLVNEIQNDLAAIWPTLLLILKKTKKVDDFLVDFSMELARDGAWKFAKSIANKPEHEWVELISIRDGKVAGNVRYIRSKALMLRIIFGIVRLGERGSVARKIEQMKEG